MESPTRYQACAKDGRDTILESVAEAAGANNWEDISVQALLMGTDQAGTPRVWTLRDLEAFQSNALPCWVLRSVQEPGGPRVVHWYNEAAYKRLGNPRSGEEVLDWWEGLTPRVKPHAVEVLKTLHETIVVQQQRVRINMNLSKTMDQNWKGLPKELFARFREEVIHVEIDGKEEACYFCVVEKELSAEQLRSTALATFTPIHSYLFSDAGELLYANHKACESITGNGFENVKDFTLPQLLVAHGQPQTSLAQAAIQKICREKAEHFCATLTSRYKGETRHTLFEMWPARDPVDSLVPALVVSAFDVTKQKETELELQSLKTTLQRHNTDLEQQMSESFIKQAALEAERVTLQTRLKDALRLHMTPCTRLDTSSPIDRTVALLDQLLESQLPATEDILAVRNTLLQSTDLRRMSNLEKQLKGQMNLTADAQQSLFTLLQDSNHASDRLAEHLASPTGTPVAQRRSSRGNNRVASPRSARRSVSAVNRPAFPLRTSLTTEVDSLLRDARTDWGFDMLKLDQATGGHSLSIFGFFLLQDTGLVERCGIPEANLAESLRAIEKGYHEDNSYHNRVHAANVLHMSQMLLYCPDGLADCGITEHMTEFSMLLAAICHDYDHPGVNNDFLCKSHSPLAMRYNDKSPLENYHASAALELLHEFWNSADYRMDEDLQQTVRSTVIELILATDMKQHFNLVSRLQGAFQTGGYTATQLDAARDLEPQLPGSRRNHISAEHRLLAIQMALKCADIGHLALPEKLHMLWVEKLQQEFFFQGDRERKAGMSVSALMERGKASKLSSSQVGFLEVVALPMYRSMAAVVPGAHVMLEAASANYVMWRSGSQTSTA